MRYVLKHGYLQQMKTRVTKQIKRQSKNYKKKQKQKTDPSFVQLPITYTVCTKFPFPHS